MAAYRLLASNASANLAGRLASIVLSLVVSTLLFRMLGTRDYGQWSLLVSVAGCSILFDFGLGAAIERRVAVAWVARDGQAVATTVTTALTGVLAVLTVLQGIVGLGVIWLGQASDSAENTLRGLAVLPSCTAMTAAGLVTGSGLTGLQRMREMQASRVTGLAVGSAAAVSVVLAGIRRLDVLLAAYCAGGVVSAWLQWRALARHVPALRFGPAWDPVAWRDMLRFGSVLQVATMVPPLAEYAFRLLLGARFGLEFAGIYDLAGRAAMMLRSLAGSLFTAMVPFGVHTLTLDGRAGATRLLRVAVKYTAVFMLPASALLLAQSGTLVDLWLGSASGAAEVLAGFRVMLAAHALGAIAVPMAMIGRAAGRPSLEAGFTAGGFAGALMAAAAAPSWVLAFLAFWGVPALAGMLLWVALARAVGVRFESAFDLIIVAALTAAVWAVGRSGEIIVTALGLPLGAFSLVLISAAGLAVVGAGANLARLIDVRQLAHAVSSDARVRAHSRSS